MLSDYEERMRNPWAYNDPINVQKRREKAYWDPTYKLNRGQEIKNDATQKFIYEQEVSASGNDYLGILEKKKTMQ